MLEGDDRVKPFSLASKTGKCPNGHSVKLSTGYSVFAPSEWEMWGSCSICGKCVSRTVGMVDGVYFEGPIHWMGEQTKEEKVWLHDVLHRHNCERCRQSGAEILALTIQDGIKNGAGLEAILSLVKKVIEKIQ